jgi:uncharacterized delta-60 repeat protein
MRYNGGSSNFYDFAVSRFNTDGTLDTTFGGTGTVYTDVSGQSDKASAVVIQSDGKIVVGGIGGDGPHFFFVLARYNPDGSLDTSFGSGGKVVTNPNPSGFNNEIWDLALQADGKILAAGDVDVGSDGEFAVARYNTNGTLDSSFGNGGIATSNPTTGFSDRAYSILVQPDGNIVLAGGSKGGNSGSNFALSRFTSAGVLDTTFGGTGTVLTDVPGSYEQAHDIVMQPNGDLVAVGYVSPTGVSPPVYNFALARYTPSGALDNSFGSNGIVVTDFGGTDQAERVALEANGNLAVVGGGVGSSISNTNTVLAFYDTTGALINDATSTHTGVTGADLAVQADGRIVAVSSQNTAFGGYVERYVNATTLTASDTVAVQDTTTPTIKVSYLNVVTLSAAFAPLPSTISVKSLFGDLPAGSVVSWGGGAVKLLTTAAASQGDTTLHVTALTNGGEPANAVSDPLSFQGGSSAYGQANVLITATVSSGANHPTTGGVIFSDVISTNIGSVKLSAAAAAHATSLSVNALPGGLLPGSRFRFKFGSPQVTVDARATGDVATTSDVTLSAAAAAHATSLSVKALDQAFLGTETLNFNGVPVTLNAPAAIGATTLSVNDIGATGIANNTTSSTPAHATFLTVRPLAVTLAAGTRITFGTIAATLSATAAAGATTIHISNVGGTSVAITGGTTSDAANVVILNSPAAVGTNVLTVAPLA